MKRRGKNTWFAIAAWLLVLTIYFSIQVGDGGLAISVHFGMGANNIQSISEVCTRVEIIEGRNNTHRYGISKPKTYTFYLSNGESYRLCSFKLESTGVKDEQLRALEGSVITVEYITTRFLHDFYPLLSLEVEGMTIVPKEIAVEHWESAWGAMLIAVCSFGGFAIIIIISNITYTVVCTARKKARLRRKKTRRRNQLERRALRKETGQGTDLCPDGKSSDNSLS